MVSLWLEVSCCRDFSFGIKTTWHTSIWTSNILYHISDSRNWDFTVSCKSKTGFTLAKTRQNGCARSERTGGPIFHRSFGVICLKKQLFSCFENQATDLWSCQLNGVFRLTVRFSSTPHKQPTIVPVRLVVCMSGMCVVHIGHKLPW